MIASTACSFQGLREMDVVSFFFGSNHNEYISSSVEHTIPPIIPLPIKAPLLLPRVTFKYRFQHAA